MVRDLIPVRVVEKRTVAQDIASYDLSPLSGASLPPFTAGSHIDVHMGGGFIRQYSLCNDPAETNRYRIAVLREPDGSGGSAWMHDFVKRGTELEISSPRNAFQLDESADFTLLLAGGIGVTPILAMARRLASLDRRFMMHYCTRSEERTAFREELTDCVFSDCVRFHIGDGESQRIDLPALLRDRPNGTHLYICGPSAFMQAALDAAKEWPSDTIHREYFSNHITMRDSNASSFTVRVASTGQEFEVPEGRSIVDVLSASGIDIPVSCEQGICGTCITPVLQGVPDHRDLFMTDAEHNANDQMTPCCSRAISALIVLDV